MAKVQSQAWSKQECMDKKRGARSPEAQGSGFFFKQGALTGLLPPCSDSPIQTPSLLASFFHDHSSFRATWFGSLGFVWCQSPEMLGAYSWSCLFSGTGDPTLAGHMQGNLRLPLGAIAHSLPCPPKCVPRARAPPLQPALPSFLPCSILRFSVCGCRTLMCWKLHKEEGVGKNRISGR